MRKIVLFSLILISFFFIDNRVYAIGNINYEISNITIGKDVTTIDGWAYLSNHNNYHGELTGMYIVAKNSSGASVTIMPEYKNNGQKGAKFTDGGKCWQRACAKDSAGNWIDKNVTPTYTNSNDCIYQNVDFTATVSTSKLVELGSNVTFSIIIKYGSAHDGDFKCEWQDKGYTSNGTIINGIKNKESEWYKWYNQYWTAKNVWDKEVTQPIGRVNKIAVNDKDTQGNLNINGQVINVVVNTSNKFITSFKVISDKKIENLETVERELKYDIIKVVVGTKETTVEGWAYITNHNNYHGYLTNLNLFATKDGKIQSDVRANITFGDGYSLTNTNGTCWLRSSCTRCEEGEGCEWKDLNGIESYSINSADCFYEHVNFTAKFRTSELRELNGDIGFAMQLNYNLSHEKVGKCTWQDEGKYLNSAILNDIYRLKNLDNFSITDNAYNYNYSAVDVGWWGESQKQKIVETEKVEFYNAENENNIIGSANNRTKVTFKTINDGYFAINFTQEKGTNTYSSNTNIHKDLECENGNFISAGTKRVSNTYYASHRDGKCSNTAKKTITATYVINETGNLTFDINRGPIVSGQGFEFKINYINAARWYYIDVEECPLITIPNSRESRCCSGSGEERKCHTCCKSYSMYSPNCPEGSTKNKEDFQKKIATETYKELKNSTKLKATISYEDDSNSVKTKQIVSDVGKWECGNIQTYNTSGKLVDVSNTSTWSPYVDWVVTCEYNIGKSYLDKKTSDVKYKKDNNYKSDNYIEKDEIYYVPLRWQSGKFNVYAKFDKVGGQGLSTVDGFDWSANYQCYTTTTQMLYDENKGGYKFFYRPISITNPFPVRAPSDNWTDWITEDNLERLANTYDQKNLEYSVNLIQNDITNIKKYNERKQNENNNLGYLDYSINIDGTTNFFRNGDLKLSAANPFKRSNSATHNKLGYGEASTP